MRCDSADEDGRAKKRRGWQAKSVRRDLRLLIDVRLTVVWRVIKVDSETLPRDDKDDAERRVMIGSRKRDAFPHFTTACTHDFAALRRRTYLQNIA